MNEQEAKAEVKHLAGLFPTLTAEQLKVWLAEALKYPRDVFRRAVDRHHLTHNFVEAPGLHEGLRAEVARLDVKAADQRARDAMTQEQWRMIDSAIDAMSDEELERWKNRVLEECGPGPVSDVLKRADPRKGRALKAMIYLAIREATGAAA
jgi:hypothetical protein